ncbi:MAG: bifunctional diaminohydroxyphosphoribosylaminopyrimidine deaminase/5-amino-6-(5-phosphoribosylamino)uracil reductase RibD [Planctomycetota bacterium]|jgi:diaminohydroxyphosphoribosylaminopyrimidine deaminase/5-amino-6-(5-phosphoribosylamino)uracil reductase
MTEPTHEHFMRLALQYAKEGRGAVEPNPIVGAVIVRGEQVLASGYHQTFGGPHAERMALADAERKGVKVRGATMYVTLEPCCHYGKTPPCTAAIISAGIRRVVIAMEDPDEQVAGRGIQQLLSAGVKVTLGFCEDEARHMMAPYVTFKTQHRPWVICKWAQTTDGYLDLPEGEGRWITGDPARRHVHLLRGRCDGILVGVETVIADDPLLTNRSQPAPGAPLRQPSRIVLDSNLNMPIDCQLVRSSDISPVIIATTIPATRRRRSHLGTLSETDVEILALPADRNGRVKIEPLLDNLGRRQWTYLLVEGGETVLRSFIDGGYADELEVYVSPHQVGLTDEQLPRLDVNDLPQVASITPAQETIGTDKLLRYRLREE